MSDSIFCTQCGSRNPASARFCDQCGAQLVKPGATPAPAAQPLPVLAVGSYTCPQCGVPALPGEAFCDNCGAPLPALGSQTAPVPQSVYPPPQPVIPGPATSSAAPLLPGTPVAAPAPPAPQVAATSRPPQSTLAPARLQIQGSGAFVALPAAADAIVGRADPASSFYPDVDLTSYGALEHGVGRRHLRLLVEQGSLFVEDLDSTNGTALNGQRLAPRQRYALKPGDLLTIGRLSLRLSV
jgi:hypothetical protein